MRWDFCTHLSVTQGAWGISEIICSFSNLTRETKLTDAFRSDDETDLSPYYYSHPSARSQRLSCPKHSSLIATSVENGRKKITRVHACQITEVLAYANS